MFDSDSRYISFHDQKKNLLTKYNTLLLCFCILTKGKTMKFKSLLLVLCFSVFGSAFADNVHLHPKAAVSDNKSAQKSMNYPGYCEIEIINNSFTDVRVFGTYDDLTPLEEFIVYRYEAPHYISLFYYNTCHPEMYLTIVPTYSSMPIYSGWARANSTIRIQPYLNKQVKAEISTR